MLATLILIVSTLTFFLPSGSLKTSTCVYGGRGQKITLLECPDLAATKGFSAAMRERRDSFRVVDREHEADQQSEELTPAFYTDPSRLTGDCTLVPEVDLHRAKSLPFLAGQPDKAPVDRPLGPVDKFASLRSSCRPHCKDQLEQLYTEPEPESRAATQPRAKARLASFSIFTLPGSDNDTALTRPETSYAASVVSDCSDGARPVDETEYLPVPLCGEGVD